jgi:hypothetical protein
LGEDGTNAERVAERFTELRRSLRPAGLRPGVGAGLSLMMAGIGSHVWETARCEAVDDQAMDVVSAVRFEVDDLVVLRCTGREIGDVAFRMRVTSAEPIEGESGFRLRLSPVALSQMS